MMGICYLCSNVTFLLPGNNYTGDSTGMPYGHMCNHTYTKNISVPSNVSIRDLHMEGPGQLLLVGDNIHIENVYTINPIIVMGKSARYITLNNVQCLTCNVAVQFLGNIRFNHGFMDMEGTRLINVQGGKFAAAVAHGNGTVSCNTQDMKILLQPTRPMQFVNCDVRDLSIYFGVFGNKYMVQFFSGDAENTETILFILKISVVAAAIILFLTCSQSRTTIKLLIDEHKKTI